MKKLLPILLLVILNIGCSTYQKRVEAVWNDPNLTDVEKMEKVLEMEERQQRLIAWSQRIGQGIQDGSKAYADEMRRQDAEWDSWNQQQQLNRIENQLQMQRFNRPITSPYYFAPY